MRGSKGKKTSKQRRQGANDIEKSAKKRGYSAKRSAQIGWATVNKQDSGGKKSGSSRGKKRASVSSRVGGTRSHKGSSTKSSRR